MEKGISSDRAPSSAMDAERDRSSSLTGLNNSASFHGELASRTGSEERPQRWMCPTWPESWKEAKLQCYLAGPLVSVSLLQWAFQLIAIIFVGHLSELALSSTSIAASVANVTGLCVMVGMATGLETLCGQAFGAQQYQLLGLYLQTALILLNISAVVLAFLFFYTGEILIGLGQDELIANEAGKYTKWLIPSLFAYASSQPIVRFLQTQSLVYPMMLCSAIASSIHVLLCWVLVYKTNVGFTGAAISTSVCNWINAILLYAYVMFSSSCSKTRTPLSWQAFHGIKGYLRLGLPSTAMVCLEWWCYEILLLLSGLLPDPQLQTSALSICLNISGLAFQIPFGLGATASTRISNELGAGQPRAAHRAVIVGVSLTVIQALVVSTLVLALHKELGRVFSSDLEVIESVSTLLLVLAVSTFLDSTQAVLSGIARGSGWQALGASINLGSFYFVALPVGACLGFLTQLRATGLWIGVVCGPFVQVVLLGSLTWVANWDKEADKAKKLVDSSTPLLQ